LQGVLNLGENELDSYQQFSLWFDDNSPPGAIVIAESVSFRSFKMVRGMDL
jgi:hypothetical protein